MVRIGKYFTSHLKNINFYFTAACASDRSIILYDAREAGPLRKMFMKLRTNKLAWNPMEAITLTCANEDYKYVYEKHDII